MRCKSLNAFVFMTWMTLAAVHAADPTSPRVAPADIPDATCETGDACMTLCERSPIDIAACERAGLLLLRQAAAAKKTATASGDAPGLHEAESLAEAGTQAYVRACEAGARGACYAALRDLSPKAFVFPATTQRLCDLGYHGGCEAFARSVLFSKAPPIGFTADGDRARALFAAACAAGSHGACLEQAQWLRRGDPSGAPPRLPEARTQFERLCSGDYAPVIAAKRAPKPDKPTLYKRLERDHEDSEHDAHLSSIAWGCRELAEMREKGEGGPVDLEQAAAAYERAFAARGWPEMRKAAERLRGVAPR